jgi:hypothetical protein
MIRLIHMNTMMNAKRMAVEITVHHIIIEIIVQDNG